METARCFTFSSGPTSSMELKRIIIELISELQKMGLRVVGTICDQGSSNQAAINSLIKDTKAEFLRRGVKYRKLKFMVGDEEVVP